MNMKNKVLYEYITTRQRPAASALLSSGGSPAFAKARLDRASQRIGGLEDAVIVHNMVISEEILHLDPSSINGVIKNLEIDDFRKDITAYLGKTGTGNEGYDRYIAIVSEYLALVAQQPLHPLEVRHLENDPPEDTDRRKYCSRKARHIKNNHSQRRRKGIFAPDV